MANDSVGTAIGMYEEKKEGRGEEEISDRMESALHQSLWLRCQPVNHED